MSTLDALLADYRALGLPLPAADARLVRWETGVTVLAGGERRPNGYLAFAEAGAEPDGPRLLLGTERHKPGKHANVTAIEPGPQAAEGIRVAWYGPNFATNAALATAIQAKARGWDALATRLLELSAKTVAGFHSFACELCEPAGPSTRAALAALARAHYTNELTQPGSDWRVIAARFEASLAMDAPAHRDPRPFLRSMHATIDHAPSAPGSVEVKIDALCEMTGWTGGFDEPPALLRVVELGFDAVPALMDHVNDERLTRTVRSGFNGWSRHQRLNGIVIEVLLGIAGDDIKNQVSRLRGEALYRFAMTTWAEAKAMGEGAFLTAHVLSSAPDARSPARFALLALAHRHPARLEEVYRAALPRPAMSTEMIAQVIAASTLPDTEKRRILEVGASHAAFDRRFSALRALRSIDPAAYARLLARALDAMPRTPTGAYWTAPESAASRLAAETSDPSVWAALLRAAKRADVGLRMQLLGTLQATSAHDHQRGEGLAFLAAFLDDDAVPDTTTDPKKWEGLWVGFDLPGISVRDVAAKTIAAILRMPAAPKRDWTRVEWDALVADVKQRPELAH